MELARSLGTNLVITRSEQGVSIIEKSGAIRHIPTEAQAIFDVTGA
jgi:D-beta-D-heptose 7-phosphate kinase/D-beta-D-heptose 1-phosphate adenosyltransferase